MTTPEQQDENKSDPLVRYKRKVTDARREQNRQAQRIWREKQKHKRDTEIKKKVLEQLKRSQGFPDDKVISLVEGSGNGTVAEVELDATRIMPIHSEHGTTTNADRMLFPEYPAPDDQGVLSFDLAEQTMELSDPDLTLDIAMYYYVPTDPSAEDMRLMWPVPDGLNSKVYRKPPPRPRNPGYSHRPFIGSIPDQNPSPYQIPTPSSLSPYSSPRFKHQPYTQDAFFIPSPYLNHLQLIGESCFSATLSIAECLGIARPAYINDHPSPFTTSSNDMIHTIPHDVRPSGYQLLLPHPCYLDCIPFPHFRNMAIYLSSVRKLDHTSFFLDLMHDGLVCWGRANADSSRGRNMCHGVPWSRRCWEARPWFWRKWGWIARMSVELIDRHASPSEAVVVGVGSDDDDEDHMLSGSRWWWMLTGEHDYLEDGVSNATDVSPLAGDPVWLQEEYGAMLSRNSVCNVGIRDKADVVHWM